MSEIVMLSRPWILGPNLICSSLLSWIPCPRRSVLWLPRVRFVNSFTQFSEGDRVELPFSENQMPWIQQPVLGHDQRSWDPWYALTSMANNSTEQAMGQTLTFHARGRKGSCLQPLTLEFPKEPNWNRSCHFSYLYLNLKLSHQNIFGWYLKTIFPSMILFFKT